MKNTGKWMVGLAMMSISSAGFAQFSMSGEIRPRMEYRHGYSTLPSTNPDAGTFVDQRSRLNFNYKSKGYATKIVLQDIRVWGSQSQLNTTDGLTSIHEAWGEAFLSDKVSMRVGRQELSYDDQRIFGSVGWAQQARSHDALRFIFKIDSTFSLDIGGAYNQDQVQSTTSFYTVPKNYKAMQYLWLHKDFSKEFGASVLFLNNGKQPSYTDGFGVVHFKDNYSQTVGTRLSAKKDKLTANVAFYYQMGVEGDWANSKINATLLSIDASYKFSDMFTAGLGFEMQSGNSQTDTTTAYNEVNHAFNPFYGTNHKFNGHMDYFYVGNHTGSVGLQDSYIRLKMTPEKFSVTADVHFFSAAANVLDVDNLLATGEYTAMAASLGTEIDLYGGFNLSKGVKVMLGYSHLIASDTMVALKGGDNAETANWAWLMITMKPQFIGKK